MTEVFSGPLPHPRIFAQYEQVLPGAGERIISMAENQSRHRQRLEERVIKSNIENEKRGMHLSFWLTVLLAIIGAGLILQDKNTAGYISLFGPSFFHAGNYIYKKSSEKKELEKKEKEATKKK